MSVGPGDRTTDAPGGRSAHPVRWRPGGSCRPPTRRRRSRPAIAWSSCSRPGPCSTFRPPCTSWSTTRSRARSTAFAALARATTMPSRTSSPGFADALGDDDVFASIADCECAEMSRRRPAGALDDEVEPGRPMRSDMIAGLLCWRDSPSRRDGTIRRVDIDSVVGGGESSPARGRRFRLRGPPQRLRRRVRRRSHRQRRGVPHRLRCARNRPIDRRARVGAVAARSRAAAGHRPADRLADARGRRTRCSTDPALGARRGAEVRAPSWPSSALLPLRRARR